MQQLVLVLLDQAQRHQLLKELLHVRVRTVHVAGQVVLVGEQADLAALVQVAEELVTAHVLADAVVDGPVDGRLEAAEEDLLAVVVEEVLAGEDLVE